MLYVLVAFSRYREQIGIECKGCAMANDDPHASLQPQLRWSAGRRRARVAARAGGTIVVYALAIVPQNVYTVLSAQQETLVFH